jgi:hypothetical protein
MSNDLTLYTGSEGSLNSPIGEEVGVIGYLNNGQYICCDCVAAAFTGNMEAFWADSPVPLSATEVLLLGNPSCTTCEAGETGTVSSCTVPSRGQDELRLPIASRPACVLCTCSGERRGHPSDFDPARVRELISLPSLLGQVIAWYRQDLADVRGALCPWHQENYHQLILALEQVRGQLAAASQDASCLCFRPPLLCGGPDGAMSQHSYFTLAASDTRCEGVEGTLLCVGTGVIYYGWWWRYPFEVVPHLSQQEVLQRERSLPHKRQS